MRCGAVRTKPMVVNMKMALPCHISPRSQTDWRRNGTKNQFHDYDTPKGIVKVQTQAVTSSAVGNTLLHNWLVGAPETIQILFAAATAYAVAATVWMLIVATRGFLEGRKVQQGYYSEAMLAGSFPQAPPLGPMITPLILIYGWMLFHSYEPDMLSLILPGSLEEGFKGGFNPQFFPKVAGIATLFSRLTTAASLWVHLLCINLFAAHSILKQGLAIGVPTHLSLLATMTLGPLGLLLHAVTVFVFRRFTGNSERK